MYSPWSLARGCLGLGQAMVDLCSGAGELEGIGAEMFSALACQRDLCGS